VTAARFVAVALLALLGGGRADAADYVPGQPVERFTGPRADYAFRCKGCHGSAGEGTPGHVPRLDGFVGLYTHLPEGRDYLMRVPGVARSVLDDARLAGVLNWMLQIYAAGQVAPGFAPFTAEEVGDARHRPLAGERDALRSRLLKALRARGLIGAAEDGLGRSAERRG
jgi:hypothetical protein